MVHSTRSIQIHCRSRWLLKWLTVQHLQAKPILLEPIMKIEVVCPEENMGDIVGDLNRRRGMMRGMDDKHGSKVVKADVPLSEMFGYVTQLRTMSSGRATSSMEFSHFAEAPKNVAEEVISKVNGKVSA